MLLGRNPKFPLFPLIGFNQKFRAQVLEYQYGRRFLFLFFVCLFACLFVCFTLLWKTKVGGSEMGGCESLISLSPRQGLTERDHSNEVKGTAASTRFCLT